ncbi:hypothetical protein GCM10028857_13480 [Salinarchaeum chitinilyticum]
MSRSGAAAAFASVGTTLERIRADRQARWVATAIAVGFGILAAILDPLGIVLGAMLVALPATDFYRGLLRGLAFGLLVVGLLGVQLLLAGTLGPAIGLGVPFYLAVEIGIGFGLLGGLVRGIV